MSNKLVQQGGLVSCRHVVVPVASPARQGVAGIGEPMTGVRHGSIALYSLYEENPHMQRSPERSKIGWEGTGGIRSRVVTSSMGWP